MPELKKFIQLLWRYRVIIIAVPLVTIMISYFIVRNLPDVYKAQAQIATGIVDENQQMSFSEMAGLQESRINQKFANMIEVMRSKSMLDLVSYQLMLHDLTSKTPFKEPSSFFKDVRMDQGAIVHAIEVYREKYQKKEGLNVRDPDQEGLMRLLRSMNYDEESLRSSLSIFRSGSSDLIYIDYESEGSELSAFVVNTLSDEFTNYYGTLIRENQNSSVKFLEALLKVREDTLQHRIAAMREYKINNNILNLNEQSSQIMSQRADYDLRLQQAEKDVIAYKGAIRNIDKRFEPQERQYLEASLTNLNQDIINTRAEIHSLYDKYVQNDFDEVYKRSIDSLQPLLAARINNLSDKYVYNPLTTKQELVQQKLTLEIQHDLALYSLNSLKKHADKINQKFNSLVPHEAILQSFERNIETVSKEYQELLAKYNQVRMESEFPIKLRQVLIAMPRGPEASKKLLLVLISGIISFTFCLLVFFVIFYFDNRIKSPLELAVATNAPVLGYLNQVGRSTLDLKDLWQNIHGTAEMREFKKQLRSARFEVNRELVHHPGKGHILSITSMNEGEGKTLLAACIAYTYVMVGKKVLLIDGNLDHPTLTHNSSSKLFLEDFMKDGIIESGFSSGIMVMANKGGDFSLFEIADEDIILERMEYLRTQFDVILIETPALSTLNKAKEWICFSDKTISVFEANQSLDETKKQYINYLTKINGQFIGWIVNKVKPEGKLPERIDTATVIE